MTPVDSCSGRFLTYRVADSFDSPRCGIPSLDVAKVIARDEYRQPGYEVVLGALRESVIRDGGEEEREVLAFGALGVDSGGWIGTLYEEARCGCCHRVVEVRPVLYDVARDSGGRLVVAPSTEDERVEAVTPVTPESSL